MPDFFEAIDKPKTFDKRRNSVTDYIRLDPDKTIKVQWVSPEQEMHTHWVQNRKLPVRCLGEGACPICARNQRLDKEDPEFIRRDTSYIANVIDLTPVKTCPHCEHVNDKVASKCGNEECAKVIVDVEAAPLKMVRYLEGTYTLFNSMKEMVLATMESMSIPETEFKHNLVRIPLSIKKTMGRDGKYFYPVIANPNDPDKVDPEEYKDRLFDYSKTGIQVSYDEMLMLMNGVPFKEVMSKRNEKKETKQSELDEFFGKA